MHYARMATAATIVSGSAILTAAVLAIGRFSPIDVPGATLTLPDAITDAGDVVGLCEIGDGKAYGFHRRPDGTFRHIGYPGALRTVARGINWHSDIVGRFETADGKGFGYLLRARR